MSFLDRTAALSLGGAAVILVGGVALGGTAIASAAGKRVVQELVGNGHLKTVEESVKPFHGVEAGHVFRVVYEQGEQRPIRISADENLLPVIERKVKNGVLILDLKRAVKTKHPMTVVCSSPEFRQFGLSGAASLSAKKVQAKNLTISLSGASRADLQGVLEQLELEASGAARLNLGRQALAKAQVKMSGASQLDLGGEIQRLEAELSGASKLFGRVKIGQAACEMSGASRAEFGEVKALLAELSGASKLEYRGDNARVRTSGVAKAIRR